MSTRLAAAIAEVPDDWRVNLMAGHAFAVCTLTDRDGISATASGADGPAVVREAIAKLRGRVAAAPAG